MDRLYDKLSEVQMKIHYTFKNTDLLQQAFTRSSYSHQHGGQNNEVLEFIGDEVLDFIVTKAICDTYGFMQSETPFYDEENDFDDYVIKAHKNEKDFTEIKKEIVSNEHLAKIIKKLGFSKYMYIGKGDEALNVKNQTKVQADLFEAIVGAMAIDSEWDLDVIAKSVIQLLDLGDYLDSIDDGTDEYPAKCQLDTAINSLKELFEHGYISEPQYYTNEEQVLVDGEYWWECKCFVRSENILKSWLAKSKKLAKKCAAYVVLCEYYDVEPVELNSYEDEEEDE